MEAKEKPNHLTAGSLQSFPLDTYTVLENGGGVFLLDKFTSDTLKGGAKKPELAKVLCENSGADVEWLTAVVNLNLSLVASLGGHSAPRFPSFCPPFPLLSSPALLCPHQTHTHGHTHNRQHTIHAFLQYSEYWQHIV